MNAGEWIRRNGDALFFGLLLVVVIDGVRIAVLKNEVRHYRAERDRFASEALGG